MLSYVSRDLQPIYVSAFSSARTLGRCELSFECSSPTHYRQFRMRIRLLGRGYAIVNSLEMERPHDRVVSQPDYSHFENSTITLCAGCRRARNGQSQSTWDWVPYFLKDNLIPADHRLCPSCNAFYRGTISLLKNTERLAS